MHVSHIDTIVKLVEDAKGSKQLFCDSAGDTVVYRPDTDRTKETDNEKQDMAKFRFDACYDSSMSTDVFMERAKVSRMVDCVFSGYNVGIWCSGVGSTAGVSESRRAFASAAYSMFRDKLESARQAFDVSLGFCFLGASDLGLVDYTVDESIPGDAILEKRMTLDDFLVHVDKVEDLDWFVVPDKIPSSILFFKLVLEPKSGVGDILTPSLCISDLGVFGAEQGLRLAQQNIKEIGLFLGQLHVMGDIPYEKNHFTHLTREYIGGNSQTLFVLFTGCEAITRDTLSGLLFGEVIKGIKTWPQINVEDRRLLDADRLKRLLDSYECTRMFEGKRTADELGKFQRLYEDAQRRMALTDKVLEYVGQCRKTDSILHQEEARALLSEIMSTRESCNIGMEEVSKLTKENAELIKKLEDCRKENMLEMQEYQERLGTEKQKMERRMEQFRHLEERALENEKRSKNLEAENTKMSSTKNIKDLEIQTLKKDRQTLEAELEKYKRTHIENEKALSKLETENAMLERERREFIETHNKLIRMNGEEQLRALAELKERLSNVSRNIRPHSPEKRKVVERNTIEGQDGSEKYRPPTRQSPKLHQTDLKQIDTRSEKKKKPPSDRLSERKNQTKGGTISSKTSGKIKVKNKELEQQASTRVQIASQHDQSLRSEEEVLLKESPPGTSLSTILNPTIFRPVAKKLDVSDVSSENSGFLSNISFNSSVDKIKISKTAPSGGFNTKGSILSNLKAGFLH